MSTQKCIIGEYCRRHGFIHGAEAEELRSRIEKILAGIDWEGRQDVATIAEAGTELDRQIRVMLDEVDARDSAAYLSTRTDGEAPTELGQAAVQAPRNPERVRRLARGFAAEWLRPDNPDHATDALVTTLTTAMMAFYAAARSADERDAGLTPQRAQQLSNETGLPLTTLDGTTYRPKPLKLQIFKTHSAALGEPEGQWSVLADDGDGHGYCSLVARFYRESEARLYVSMRAAAVNPLALVRELYRLREATTPEDMRALHDVADKLYAWAGIAGER